MTLGKHKHDYFLSEITTVCFLLLGTSLSSVMSLGSLGHLTPADLSSCVVRLSLAPAHTTLDAPPTYTRKYKCHTH